MSSCHDGDLKGRTAANVTKGQQKIDSETCLTMLARCFADDCRRGGELGGGGGADRCCPQGEEEEEADDCQGAQVVWQMGGGDG